MAPLHVICSLFWEEETRDHYTTRYIRVYTEGIGRNKTKLSATQDIPRNSVIMLIQTLLSTFYIVLSEKDPGMSKITALWKGPL